MVVRHGLPGPVVHAFAPVQIARTVQHCNGLRSGCSLVVGGLHAKLLEQAVQHVGTTLAVDKAHLHGLCKRDGGG